MRNDDILDLLPQALKREVQHLLTTFFIFYFFFKEKEPKPAWICLNNSPLGRNKQFLCGYFPRKNAEVTEI